MCECVSVSGHSAYSQDDMLVVWYKSVKFNGPELWSRVGLTKLATSPNQPESAERQQSLLGTGYTNSSPCWVQVTRLGQQVFFAVPAICLHHSWPVVQIRLQKGRMHVENTVSSGILKCWPASILCSSQPPLQLST